MVRQIVNVKQFSLIDSPIYEEDLAFAREYHFDSPPAGSMDGQFIGPYVW
jgi:hypothetical protein